MRKPASLLPLHLRLASLQIVNPTLSVKKVSSTTSADNGDGVITVTVVTHNVNRTHTVKRPIRSVERKWLLFDNKRSTVLQKRKLYTFYIQH